MTDIDDLLKIIDAYQLATGLTDSSVSTHVFNDGKKITRLRGGKDINVSRFNAAFNWFSQNWPDGVV